MTTALYPFVSATSQVDKVMELANIRNGITDVKVSSVNCTLELPLVIDPLLNNGRNTSIVIKAILGKDYHGSRTVKYERLPIEKFLTGLTPTMPVPAVNSVVNVAAVTEWLRTAYGLDVVASDFTLSPIDTSVLPAAGTLTAKTKKDLSTFSKTVITAINTAYGAYMRVEGPVPCGRQAKDFYQQYLLIKSLDDNMLKSFIKTVS